MKNKLIILLALTSSVIAQEQKEPAQLLNTRYHYDEAVKKLNAQYVTALEKIKIKLTKAGDLHGALAVEAEIKKYSEANLQVKNKADGKDVIKEEFIEKVVSKKWGWRHKNDNTSWVTLLPNKSVVLNWTNVKFFWEYIGDRTIKIESPSIKAVITLKWNKEYTSYTGFDKNLNTGKVIEMWGKLIK